MVTIDAHALAERTDLIGKSHFQGMEAVAGILEHLGNFEAGLFHWSYNIVVEAGNGITAPRSRTSDRRERWMIKIVYRTALTEKFGVKTNVEIPMCRFLGRLTQDRNQYVAHGAWQHRTAKNDAMVVFLPE